MANLRAHVLDFLGVLKRIVLEPFAARVKSKNRFGFFHQPVARAADVASGYVDEFRCRSFREGHHVLDTIHVRAEGFVHGREEIHQPRTIDDRAETRA